MDCTGTGEGRPPGWRVLPSSTPRGEKAKARPSDPQQPFENQKYAERRADIGRAPPHSSEILHSRRIKLYSATIVNAITLSVLFGVTAACPNECNGRGFCNPQRSQECICDAGFTGVDCSLRVCPAGAAWIDYAHAKVRRCNIKAKY